MDIAMLLTIAGIYVLWCAVRMVAFGRISMRLIRDHHSYRVRPSAGRPRIAVLGDSTAAGVGTGDGTGSVVSRFAQDFPDSHVFLDARSGRTVEQMRREFPRLPEASYDLLLLQIGGNDILRNIPLAAFAESLRGLFRLARTAGIRVLAAHSGNIGLAPFFPWPFNRIMSWQTRRYRAVYRRVAREEGVVYVDLYRDAAHDEFRGSPEFYAPDRLHLTGKGYGSWYREIREAMSSEE